MASDGRAVTARVPSWLWWALQAHADEAKVTVGALVATLIDEALAARAANAGGLPWADIVECELPASLTVAEVTAGAGLAGEGVGTFLAALIGMGWLCWCDERRVAADVSL